MIELESLNQRIDIRKACALIALAKGKEEPVAPKTVYAWVKRGLFPRQIPNPAGAAVWNTRECLEKLGLDIPVK